MYFVDKNGNKIKPEKQLVESYNQISPNFLQNSSPYWLTILMVVLLCILSVGMVVLVLKKKY